MAAEKKYGVLLLNTGSSSAARTRETRVYLRQFLSDPRVFDAPAWKRWLVLNLFILPFRPAKTAAAYQKVWTDRGSPLIAISEDFAAALGAALPEAEVEIGMAYGEPSIAQAFASLMEKNVSKIIAAPMFPQYASATTGSVVSEVFRIAGESWNVPPLTTLAPYYDDAGYLDAWAAVAGPKLEAFQADHVLLSFHGLPERHIRKGDPTESHCLAVDGCCDTETEANQFCYRRHCLTTARGIAERLGFTEEMYTVAFQSRLGRDPWLAPAADAEIERLGKSGVKRLAVMSPAFTADCLETLEEIGMEGKSLFLENGGDAFSLVPSLNTDAAWVEAFARLIREA
jgi:ferrochelatase